MNDTQTHTPGGIPAVAATAGSGFKLSVQDVTGTHQSEVSDVQPTTPAGAVAAALAARLGLPENVPWTLRSETSGQFLEDTVELGRQIQSGERVTLAPKTHLGCHPR